MATSSGYLKRLRDSGIKSEDAKQEWNFTISKKDCKKGLKGRPQFCVIAKKLTKTTPGVLEVHVFDKVAHVLRVDPKTKRLKNYRHSVDVQTREAIRSFDQKGHFPTGLYTFRVLRRSDTAKEKKARDNRRKKKPAGKGGGLMAPKVRAYIRRYEDNWM